MCLLFVTPELLKISNQFILLISNNKPSCCSAFPYKKFLQMVESRNVFDLPHSFPVTHSPFVVLYERLAKAKLFSGWSYAWGLRLSALLLPVITREQVTAPVSCSCCFLDKNFNHQIQVEHCDCFTESEVYCMCKHICSVKKTEHVNLIFAGG